MEPNANREIPVVIVGGGPVGLALALELGLRRVKCLLIEQRYGNVTLPKMNSVSTRTMEFCRRWGVAEKVKDLGVPRDYPFDVSFVTSIDGYELLRFELPSWVARGELNYTPEGNYVCSQLWFDPILLERVRSLPDVSVQHKTRFSSFKQDAAEIQVETTNVESGRQETIIAKYLVGCDGAESRVRELTGIKMQGLSRLNTNMNVFFRCDEILSLQVNRPAQMYRLVGADGVWGNIIAVDGRGLWRMTVHLRSDSDPNSFDVASHIRKAVGRTIPFEILAVFSWVRSQGVAEHYRNDRVFLAGDSAHQMSTTGGFGMNTGIGDAVDLAWKLEAAIYGWGGPRLLDTYETERKPIAVRNLEEAALTFRDQAALPSWGEAIFENSSLGARARAAFSETATTAESRRQYETEGVALGYRYDSSPIICSDGTPPPADEVCTYTQTARPGARAPHAWLSDARSTLDLFGEGFTLLRFGEDSPPIDEFQREFTKWGVPLTVIDIQEQQIATLYERKLVLIRPDGHVAWRSNELPTVPSSIIDRVRGAAY
jgi:2-polyprenyl-6-methoxyphenol hydroxylase-like FAD-dependent oxidoreductase